jgi:PAS domain S-box-containing protein
LRKSWERLLAGDVLCLEPRPEAIGGLRPTIIESWRRSLATGLDPTDMLAPVEADQSEVQERWLDHPLGSVAHVLAAQLGQVAEESNSLVVVTDASGLLLRIDGAEGLKDRAREMNLLEGARYSEMADGTNGIGTALAADHPLQVFAFEHFNQLHHEWVCSGAPVHDPVSGRPVGLVDLSGLWKIAHPRSLELVTTAARTMERCLLEARRDQDARLRRRYSDLMTRSTDLLVNREGYLLTGDDSANPPPLDVPESGGEIAMDDGSLAIAEPLGQGEAYLVRQLAPRHARAAPAEALERAERRTRELAKKRAVPSRARDPECAREAESGLPGTRAGERLNAYLEAAIDCVIMADASGRIVEFNPAAERTFGYSREEALGRTMAELIVPRSLRERHAAAFARFVKTREGSMLGQRVELTGMRADGSEFPVELALSQVEAEPVLICGALRDISAAKQAENHLREVADEQAALRQVATLVAHESSPDRLIAAVVEQVARVFDVPFVSLMRYEPTAAVVVGSFSESDHQPFPIDSRWQLDTPGLLATIRQTGRAARVEDYAQMPGDSAGVVRAAGIRSAAGTPIVVGGRVWGAIVLLSPRSASLPEDTGARLTDFTDLVATALANAESRASLAASEARTRDLAAEQAALRRVATLVAKGTSSDELFAAVTREAADVLDVPVVALQRYETDRTFTMVAIAGETNFTVGSRWPVEDEGLAGVILATGRPARKDDYTTMPGPLGAALRDGGIVSTAGVPIIVQGSIWGFMTAGGRPGRPTPDGTEERLARFTELVATAIADSQARDHLAQLATEQSALRRVATLVARAPASEQLFSTVAREVASVLDVPGVIVTRYDGDGVALTLGEAFRGELAGAERFIGVGTRMPRDPGSLTAQVFDTHGPARVDDFSMLPGRVGELARSARLGSGCAGPIVVNGAVWGKLCVFSRVGEVLPPGTEDRLNDFIELVATAIANYEARAELAASEARARGLADEQAALRRVATLVARGVSPEKIFSAVTNEMAQLFGSPQACVGRFEPDGSGMVVVGVSDGSRGISIGSRWELEDYMASTGVYRTGRSVRVEQSDLEHVSGPMADVLREIGAISNVGAPIVVEGKQWGFVTVTDVNQRLPADAEQRLEKFAELVATAIANAESRAELAASEARARELAEEHAALRRVATLVAEGAKSEAVFSAVAHEVAHVFRVQHVTVCRYEPDTILVLSSFEPDASPTPFPAGRRLPLDAPSLPAEVHRTGEPARIDDFTRPLGPTTPSDGLYAVAREAGLTAAVGVPIVVDGTVWGAVNIASTKLERFPPDAEERLARFTQLVATSVSNATMRTEVQRLADEQAALRRVAMLVAEGASTEGIFSATAQEVAEVLGVDFVTVVRHESDGGVVLSSAGVPLFPVGSRWPLDVPSLPASVYMTRGPVRIDDFTDAEGLNAIARDEAGVKSAVGVPIIIDGAVWASINTASTRAGPYPADAEERLTRFADLIATAVSNAAMRDQLAASRARVIAASDETRRRIERDLHDGAQQRLVTLAVRLGRAEAKIPAGLDELRADVTRVSEGLTAAVAELRELSRGIHPSILTEGGLSPALKALGRRSAVRVKLDVGFEHRLPDQVEVAAYYTVSEALTNASKHANARCVWISLRVDHDMLLLSIRDDGVGGADPRRGSGLTGLMDRIEALGGEIQIESLCGSGTLIEVEIPIAGRVDRSGEPNELLARATTPGSSE